MSKQELPKCVAPMEGHGWADPAVSNQGRSGRPRRLWTTTEERALRDHWPNKPLLRHHLPRRSDIAIRHRAKALGLVEPPMEVGWTPEELRWVENNWGHVAKEELTHKLGKSWCTIRRKAAELGLRMGNRRVVDGIRLPIGWTEADYRLLQSCWAEPTHRLADQLGKKAKQVQRFRRLLRSLYAMGLP
jgi:hypothetical protein